MRVLILVLGLVLSNTPAFAEGWLAFHEGETKPFYYRYDKAPIKGTSEDPLIDSDIVKAWVQIDGDKRPMAYTLKNGDVVYVGSAGLPKTVEIDKFTSLVFDDVEAAKLPPSVVFIVLAIKEFPSRVPGIWSSFVSTLTIDEQTIIERHAAAANLPLR